jgi:hypothetical protein
MSSVKCFMLDEIDLARYWLRRYSTGPCVVNNLQYHNAMFLLEDRKPDYIMSGIHRYLEPGKHPESDPRWPTNCLCGYEFKPGDAKQLFLRQLYKHHETGEILTWEDAPTGAMRYCPWLEGSSQWVGPDGKSLVVKLPDGTDWHIDGRCSNCTKKTDRIHKCWCRHGTPPNITVDKNGDTCAAGGGSILSGDYHGFLQNGYLTNCPD